MFAAENAILHEKEEHEHYQQHLHAIMNYSNDNQFLTAQTPLTRVCRVIKYKEILDKKSKRLNELIQINQRFLNLLLPNFPKQTKPTKQINKSKVRSTIKQFYREWSAQSKEKVIYLKILNLFQKYKKQGKVLIPGCGLGRIVFEFVKAGYATQGNQISYFMLLGSDFILNHVDRRNSISIAPFIHSTQNDEMFKIINIPDALACEEVPEDSDFSMIAGQFLDVYSKNTQAWDGLITCFFLDTANNIFQYINTIENILKKDGIWINYGPLLYHYREMPEEISVQVSWEALQKYILTKFEIIEKFMDKTSYCHHQKNLNYVQYNCICFAARKLSHQ